MWPANPPPPDPELIMRYLVALAAVLFPSIALAAPGAAHQMEIFVNVDGAARQRLDRLEEAMHFDVVYFTDGDAGGMEQVVAAGEMDYDSSTSVSFATPRGHFDSAWVSVRTAWKSRRVNLVKCSLPTFDPANPPASIEISCSLI